MSRRRRTDVDIEQNGDDQPAEGDQAQEEQKRRWKGFRLPYTARADDRTAGTCPLLPPYYTTGTPIRFVHSMSACLGCDTPFCVGGVLAVCFIGSPALDLCCPAASRSFRPRQLRATLL